MDLCIRMHICVVENDIRRLLKKVKTVMSLRKSSRLGWIVCGDNKSSSSSVRSRSLDDLKREIKYEG